MKQFHPFHMVFNSPWPLIMSFATLNLLISIVFWITKKEPLFLFLMLSLVMVSSYQWWRDISYESSIQGFHSIKVISGLRLGMLLFITSEILFFASFFWTFFHSSLAPNMELNSQWPPINIMAINPFNVPLLNTAILLSSGITVTWAHHSLINLKNKETNMSLMLTIVLGIYFTLLQAWEYWDAPFTLSDSVYGSIFFLATGFHGGHVLIGTLFIFFSLLRHKMNLFSLTHHTGLESAIWYWHFVDVVWLFLYTFMYWWSY